MLGFIFGTGLYIANNKKIRLTSKNLQNSHLVDFFPHQQKTTAKGHWQLGNKMPNDHIPSTVEPQKPAKPKNPLQPNGPMAAAKPTINAHIPKVEIITKSLGKDVFFVGKMIRLISGSFEKPVNSPVEEKVVDHYYSAVALVEEKALKVREQQVME